MSTQSQIWVHSSCTRCMAKMWTFSRQGGGGSYDSSDPPPPLATGLIMRCHVPRMQNKFIEYRSQKKINKTLFLESVAGSNLRSCLTLEDPEHGWILFTNNFKSTIDQHAAMKKRKVRSNQPPYISMHMRKDTKTPVTALCSEGPMFRRLYVQKIFV